MDLIIQPDIYVPLIAFVALLIITIVIRNLFYKN